jgi:hypothetical protein
MDCRVKSPHSKPDGVFMFWGGLTMGRFLVRRFLQEANPVFENTKGPNSQFLVDIWFHWCITIPPPPKKCTGWFKMYIFDQLNDTTSYFIMKVLRTRALNEMAVTVI